MDVPGGLKRCGGQGDILSGNVGALLAWGKCYETGAFGYAAALVCAPYTRKTDTRAMQGQDVADLAYPAACGGRRVDGHPHGVSTRL